MYIGETIARAACVKPARQPGSTARSSASSGVHEPAARDALHEQWRGSAGVFARVRRATDR
jgi:hypothetical protein